MRILSTTHGLQVQFVFSNEHQDMTVQLRSVTDMILSYFFLLAPGSRQRAYKCDPTTHGLQVQFVFSSEQQDLTVQLRSVRDMILSYTALPARVPLQRIRALGRGLIRMIRSHSFLPARVPLSWGSRQRASILLLFTCPSAPVLGLINMIPSSCVL